MPLLTKGTIAGVLAAGTITIGATMVTFSGTDTLDQAGTKLTEQATELETFAANETQLVNKIGEMKTAVDKLKTQKTSLLNRIDDLKLNGSEAQQQLISDLEAQVAQKQTQIDSMNTEIASIQADLDAKTMELEANSQEVADRIAALEAEVEKANQEAADLQAQMDAMGQTPTSDQTAVDTAMATDSTVSEIPPEGGETPESTPAYDVNVKMQTGLPQHVRGTDLEFTSPGMAGDNLIITNTYFQPATIVVDGQSMTVPGEGQLDLGLKIDLDGAIVETPGDTILLTND